MSGSAFWSAAPMPTSIRSPRRSPPASDVRPAKSWGRLASAGAAVCSGEREKRRQNRYPYDERADRAQCRERNGRGDGRLLAVIFAGKDVDRLGGRNRCAYDGGGEGEGLQLKRDRKAEDDKRHQCELDRRERGRAAKVGPQAVHRHAKADGEEGASRQGVRQDLEIGVDRSWHRNACRGPGDAD